MSVSLVIGGQWGDEGKAKIIDSLGGGVDYIVRFQGGANAGHTVVVGDEVFAFHLVPSGILYPGVRCILGGGMVIDPISLVDEISLIRKRGIKIKGRILISAQAHVVLPHHIAADKHSEKRKGKSRIGSTGRGIAPAYEDKVGRSGLRMCDMLFGDKVFEEKLRARIRSKNREFRLMGMNSLSMQKTVSKMIDARKILKPMIVDTRQLLWKAADQKKTILLEGAQGTLLDIDHGTYPFVTSSSVIAGGASVGTGIPPSAVKKIIGVFKAYCTRVGNGPFPTEERGALGNKLREKGREFGTTTGRPRRCGWFDAVAARTAVRLNGITEIALSKLDVLDSFKTIKICAEYGMGRKKLHYFPADTALLERVKPRYIKMDGWGVVCESRSFDDLPAGARKFVRTLEKLIDCRIRMISMGPERGELMRL